MRFAAYTQEHPLRPSSDWNRRNHPPFPSSQIEAEEKARELREKEKVRVAVVRGSEQNLRIILTNQEINELMVNEVKA